MTVETRALTADDWELFRSMRVQALAEAPNAFRSTYDAESAQSDDHWRDMVSRTAGHPDSEVFLGSIDGRPGAIAFVRVEHDSATARIGAMWVDPAFRGRGVGSQVLTAALDFGKAAGAEWAELAVTEDNGPAQRLYAAAGFEPTSRTEPLRDDSDLTVRWMRRSLDSS
jgi:ribosomal protein S18 acetylase RimI-like enzyme